MGQSFDTSPRPHHEVVHSQVANEDQSKPKIFVSYKWSAMKDDVHMLANRLEETNRFGKVWIDRKKLFNDILEGMQEGIDESDVIIIFFDDEYQLSQACEDEARAAHRQRKQKVFVKMKLGPVSYRQWFKLIIADHKYIDYYRDPVAAWGELLKSIEHALKKNSAKSTNWTVQVFGDDYPVATYTERPELEKQIQMRVSKLVNSEEIILMVYGSGGLGKSSLLRHTLSREFLKTIGISAVGWLNVFAITWEVDVFDEDKFYEHLANLFLVPWRAQGDAKSCLQRHLRSGDVGGGKTLIVLDDVFHRDVFSCVATLSSDVKTICISRRNYHTELIQYGYMSDPALEMAEMSNGTIREMMLKIINNKHRLSENEMTAIVDICHGLPLIARVVSAKIASEPNIAGVKEYVNQLLTNTACSLMTETFTDHKKARNIKEETISKLLLFDFGCRPENVQRQYYAFLVFDEGSTVAIEDLAIFWKCDTKTAKKIGKGFYDLSLVRCDDQYNKFDIHSFLYNAALEFASKNQYQDVNQWRLHFLANFRKEASNENVLHLAVKDRRERLCRLIVDLMLAQNYEFLFQLQQPTRQGELPLHYFLKDEWLLNEGTLWEHNYSLDMACRLADRLLIRDKERARQLLINTKDSRGKSALDLLLRTVSAPDTPVKWYRNALLISSAYSYVELTKLLVENGADINSVDEDGNNALMMAAAYGESGSIFYLLKSTMIDVNYRSTQRGKTALMISYESCGVGLSLWQIMEWSTNPVDLDVQDENGDTALMLALKFGDAKNAKLLLRKGANVKMANNDNISTMWLAVLSGMIEVVKIVHNKGGNLEKEEIYVLRHRAKFRRQLEVTSFLDVLGTEINSSSQPIDYLNIERALFNLLGLSGSGVEFLKLVVDGEIDGLETKVNEMKKVNDESKAALGSLMVIACFMGYEKIVKILPAEIDFRNSAGNTPAMIAAENGHKEVVKVLIELKADVNAVNRDNWSALMFAAENGHDEIVTMLISAGANVDDVNKDGLSALMLASRTGQDGVVKLLIDAKADVSLIDKDNCSALMMAAQNGHHETVRTLIGAKAEVNAVDKKDNWTALMKAATNGHLDVSRTLISAGANVSAIDKDYWTALMLAARYGHENVVQMLIDAGADVNAVNKNSVTALMKAAWSGHNNVVRTLIAANADVNAVDRDGLAPLMITAKNGDIEVVWTLLEAGADLSLVNNNGQTAEQMAAANNQQEVVSLLQGRS